MNDLHYKIMDTVNLEEMGIAESNEHLKNVKRKFSDLKERRRKPLDIKAKGKLCRGVAKRHF